MRRLFRFIGILFLILACILAGLIISNELDESTRAGIAASTTPVIDRDWPGTPIDQHGRFMNHEFPFIPKLRGLLTWQLSPNPFRTEKSADAYRLPVLDPQPFLNADTDGVMWLGHASFLIRSEGVNVLIDPVFGDPAFIRRLADVESQLPGVRSVDYVLISHDHRDHLDEPSIRAIADRFPNTKFLAGNGSVDLLAEWVGDPSRIATANWFEKFPIADERVSIYFVPVRHWSRRGLTDLNRRLWGGYVLQTKSLSVYHGGDSGYGDHYKMVGRMFPSIDLFLIGIGAYEPRWFMEPNHNNPEDVAKAFRDIDAKYLVPMHYGTFDLSDEPPSWPIRDLTAELEKLGLANRLMIVPINGVIDGVKIDRRTLSGIE